MNSKKAKALREIAIGNSFENGWDPISRLEAKVHRIPMKGTSIQYITNADSPNAEYSRLKKLYRQLTQKERAMLTRKEVAHA